MKFKVTDPDEAARLYKQGAEGKYSAIVTTLLETYQKYGNKKVVEVDNSDSPVSFHAGRYGGIAQHLWNRTRDNPKGPLAVRCRKVGPSTYQLWLEPDTSPKAVSLMEYRRKKLRTVDQKAG